MTMKDIILSTKLQKNELKWLAACFLVAILMNACSIIVYKTSWSELYTQYLWVLIITCALYALSAGIRICLYFVKKLF